MDAIIKNFVNTEKKSIARLTDDFYSGFDSVSEDDISELSRIVRVSAETPAAYSSGSFCV